MRNRASFRSVPLDFLQGDEVIIVFEGNGTLVRNRAVLRALEERNIGFLALSDFRLPYPNSHVDKVGKPFGRDFPGGLRQIQGLGCLRAQRRLPEYLQEMVLGEIFLENHIEDFSCAGARSFRQKFVAALVDEAEGGDGGRGGDQRLHHLDGLGKSGDIAESLCTCG